MLRATEYANPIILIDEIDKTGGSGCNGKKVSTLLTMLEPKTRGCFYDKALGASFVLTFMNWILSANDIAELGKPLLSRLRLVHMPPPPLTAADRVVDTILTYLAKRQGLSAEDAPLLESQVREALVSAVLKGMSRRRLKAVLEESFVIEIRRTLAS
jgi:ATP-dependent Lon protease